MPSGTLLLEFCTKMKEPYRVTLKEWSSLLASAFHCKRNNEPNQSYESFHKGMWSVAIFLCPSVILPTAKRIVSPHQGANQVGDQARRCANPPNARKRPGKLACWMSLVNAAVRSFLILRKMASSQNVACGSSHQDGLLGPYAVHTIKC